MAPQRRRSWDARSQHGVIPFATARRHHRPRSVALTWIVGAILAAAVLAAVGGSVVGSITVLDGDTVRAGGTIYRLVGFDTPETGERARCRAEQDLAQRAADRLRALLASGKPVELRPVPCNCRPGTQGTARCNHGRACAVLEVGGSDVGPVLIREGLARRYVCSGTSCPPRPGWCG